MIRVALAGVAVAMLLSAEDPPGNDLPAKPFRLNAEALAEGNPLAGFLELLALEEAYHDAGRERLFFEALATHQSFLGDTDGALRSWAEVHRGRVGRGPILRSPLDAYEPASAVTVILQKAEQHRVIMLGEEHVQPQTRSILLPLLRGLHKRGFRYFAAETFSDDVERTTDLGYAIQDTGFYTCDPVFAEAVAEALRLATGLQVASIDSNKWAISSRGFNAQLSNKMLVLIDGRDVYTPPFSGVHWDD